MKRISATGKPDTARNKEKKTHRRLLLVLLVISALIRFYGITNPLYDMNYWRQTETAALAQNYYEDNLPFFYPEIDWIGPNGHAEMEFPLYPYILSWVYRLFWPSDIFGRILTLLCALGAIWSIYDIGRQLLTPGIGLLAAAFFSASPLAIYFGRTYQPDMMMVFFSTFALALLLRWDNRNFNFPLYLSAFALMIGVLLKPPSLLVILPILWILYQQQGKRFVLRKEWWLYALIIGVPTFLWYSHAHTFFEEFGATFMWHFKDFSIKEHLLSVYINPEFWKTIVWRFGDEILVYIGIVPFVIGLISLLFPYRAKTFFVSWLIGIAGLYLLIPGHHIGHSYYSLLAIPPIALISAIGCFELWNFANHWIKCSFAWMMIFPISVACLGMYLLDSRGYYGKIYTYYDDAKALQETVPKGTLIAVMDDLMHTPEFFYFINRKGWHRAVYPVVGADNSPWVEQVRTKGAQYYFGLTEFKGNHPFPYLQNHIHGQYLWDHYRIEEIGCQYFVARLDQPIYGNHLFSDYTAKTVAIAWTSQETAGAYLRNTVPLYEWQKADAILLDFHTLHPDELRSVLNTYNAAVQNGFVITHQESGRLLLEKRTDIEPILNFISAVGTTQFLPSKPEDNGQLYLGYFDAGRYRVSFQFPNSSLPAPVEMKILDRTGIPIALRILKSAHLSHIDDGERPECIFQLDHPAVLYAWATTEKGPIQPASVVWMPDVQSITEPMVIQAEQLNRNQAEVVEDSTADRETALWSWTDEDLRFMTYGPYFEYPAGMYDFIFRLRAPNKWNLGNLELGVYGGDSVLAHKELFPSTKGNQSLGQQYADIPLSATVEENVPIEIRVFLHKHAEVLFDTVSIQQRKRKLQLPNYNQPLCLITNENNPCALTKSGRIFNSNGEIRRRIKLFSAPIAWAAWHENTGELYIDDHGRVIGEKNEEYWAVPGDADEKIVNFDISLDGASIGILTDKRRLFIWNNGTFTIHPLPNTDFPLRDLLLIDQQTALVLDGKGSFLTVGEEVPKVEGIPLFWADVARAIVYHPKGIYVLDSLGAIHSSKGAPPIQSPFYKPEDWILDAYRTKEGNWYLLSREGEILTFHE